MNAIKFIQIPFVKNKKIISNNSYNVLYITNINFLHEKNKIIIEFANEANNPTIHLNIKITNKEEKERFKKLEPALYEALSGNNFVSILGLLNIYKLELLESEL